MYVGKEHFYVVHLFNTRHYSIVHVHVHMIAGAGYTVVLCVILMFLISNYLYM